MEGIEDEHVREAGEFLGLLDGALPRRSSRLLRRTLLIAALIAALFTVTAYAMGWFGLGERVMEQPSVRRCGGEAPLAQSQRLYGFPGICGKSGVADLLA